MAKAPSPPAVGIVAPESAVSWALWRIRHVAGPTRKRIPRLDRLKGDPLPDGSLPDTWPVGEWDVRLVQRAFGPGRYRVEFYDTAGSKVYGKTFDLVDPSSARPAGPRLPRQRQPTMGHVPEELTEDGAKTRRPDTISAWDMLTMLQQRESEVAERTRMQAVEDRQRDREFFAMVMNLVRPQEGGAGARGDSIDMLRREMSLAVDKQMFGIRKDLQAAIGPGQASEPERDDDDGPETIEDGVSRIGLSLLREIEDRAPELIEEAIPRIAQWLQEKGFSPSPKLAAELAASAPPEVRNGAKRANRV